MLRLWNQLLVENKISKNRAKWFYQNLLVFKGLRDERPQNVKIKKNRG